MGIPKYRIGKAPGLHPNRSMYWFSQSFASTNRKFHSCGSLFSTLITVQKQKELTSCCEPVPGYVLRKELCHQRIVRKKAAIYKMGHLSTQLIICFALFMKSASISATILNSIGERGSPCRSPFFCLEERSYFIVDIDRYTPTRNEGFNPSNPLGWKSLQS